MGSATADPLETLRRVFGFSAWRGLQEQAIARVMAGGDALVLMPTGGGKSLCYQLPALCRPGTALVVSPLIALMDDQVAALRQLGIAAGALHSELEPEEANETSRALTEGRLDLLYVSPERLLAGNLIDRLRRLELSLIAIDEAHCVSQWGHEFRPEYRALSCLPQRLPGVPRVALTATADPRTRADILASLAMPDAEMFAASFHRENLHIAASPKTAETAQLLDLMKRHPGACGIVYCCSRAKTERTARTLSDKGVLALPYHAGLLPADKRAALAKFRSGEPMVMVATIAFGMGIDRLDVRFVVHLDMPDSPEAYYQQIGRAGRDGLRADTLLLHGGEDIARARHWLSQSVAAEAQQAVMRARLEQMIALTETGGCRTHALLACFGEDLSGPCGHCDLCDTPCRAFNGTVEAQKVLSAVYRTGQMFGAVHIANVLRGEKTDMVDKHGHDRLPLFGVGRDRDEAFWRGVMRQLVAIGALQRGEERTSGLQLDVERARAILRGEQIVTLHEEPAAPPRAPRTYKRGRSEPVVVAPAAGNAFEALRAWRLAEAKRQAVPPYVIFWDSVLADIAQSRPTNLAALAEIKGVGASKLERYGPGLLAALGSAG